MRKGIIGLYGITHGVDVGVGGLVVAVHADAARLAQLEARVHRELGLWRNADAHDDGLGEDEQLALRRAHRDALVVDSGDGGREVQLHAVIVELLVEDLHHVVVERSEDLVGALDEGDLLARGLEVLSHLDADEAATHHGNALHLVRRLLDGNDVAHVAHAEHVVAVDACNALGHDGARAGGEHELVVGFLIGLVGGEVVHRDRLAVAVDGGDLAAHAYVEVVLALERRGSHEDQAVAILHDAAQVVRERAVGERHVLAALEDHDLGLGVEAPQARRGGHSSGYTADDNELHAITLPLASQPPRGRIQVPHPLYSRR